MKILTNGIFIANILICNQVILNSNASSNAFSFLPILPFLSVVHVSQLSEMLFQTNKLTELLHLKLFNMTVLIKLSTNFFTLVNFALFVSDFYLARLFQFFKPKFSRVLQYCPLS